MRMRQWTRFAVGVLIGTHAGCAASDGGFVPIFDGKTLAGWRVVPPERSADWTVRDGAIVGTSEGKGSYLVWHDDSLSDFELKLGYRFLTPGNTGVQVRSRVVESRSHPLYGYHADLGHVGIGPRVLGAWDFHGAPRGDVLVRRGQRVVIDVEGDADAREEFLGKLAERVAKRALQTGRAVALDPMNGRDRRLIHVALRDRDDVATISEGEGQYRQVVVVPENSDEFEDARAQSERSGGNA